MLLYLFHILRVSEGDAQVHWKISLDIYCEEKKQKERFAQKSDERKIRWYEELRKMTESKNGDERDEDKGAKVVARAGVGCHSPSGCRFRREDRGICRRQPLKRLSSPSTVSCHSPFLRGRCIALKFMPKIRHLLADVTENLIAKISDTYISYYFL